MSNPVWLPVATNVLDGDASRLKRLSIASLSRSVLPLRHAGVTA